MKRAHCIALLCILVLSFAGTGFATYEFTSQYGYTFCVDDEENAWFNITLKDGIEGYSPFFDEIDTTAGETNLDSMRMIYAAHIEMEDALSLFTAASKENTEGLLLRGYLAVANGAEETQCGQEVFYINYDPPGSLAASIQVNAVDIFLFTNFTKEDMIKVLSSIVYPEDNPDIQAADIPVTHGAEDSSIALVAISDDWLASLPAGYDIMLADHEYTATFTGEMSVDDITMERIVGISGFDAMIYPASEGGIDFDGEIIAFSITENRFYDGDSMYGMDEDALLAMGYNIENASSVTDNAMSFTGIHYTDHMNFLVFENKEQTRYFTLANGNVILISGTAVDAHQKKMLITVANGLQPKGVAFSVTMQPNIAAGEPYTFAVESFLVSVELPNSMLGYTRELGKKSPYLMAVEVDESEMISYLDALGAYLVAADLTTMGQLFIEFKRDEMLLTYLEAGHLDSVLDGFAVSFGDRTQYFSDDYTFHVFEREDALRYMIVSGANRLTIRYWPGSGVVSQSDRDLLRTIVDSLRIEPINQ